MGGLNSYLIGCCNSNNNCPENHCKLKISHSNRSFTFNKIDDSDYNEPSYNEFSSNVSTGVININNASEEILMTLPGVNRIIAHDIVLHRNQIGKFEKIEDLVLVNGIGAAKFKLIKPEISIESFQTNNDNAILINQLDVFQLTMIPGFSQTLAQRIVCYRDKKGPFKNMKDLLRVRGVNLKFLKSLKPHIQLSGFLSVSNDNSKHNHEKRELANGHLLNSTIIKFETESEMEFNFSLSIWKVKDKIPNLDIIEKVLPNQKPTIFIVLYSVSNSASMKTIHRKLNEKYGDEYFSIVKCNVGDNCIHNNTNDKLVIISNFSHYSIPISLSSLIEDQLTCFILTIQSQDQFINCVVLYRCLTTESVNLNDEMLLINDLSVKLKTDRGNSFVFFYDSSLANAAIEAFSHNGFHFTEKLVEPNNKDGWSVAQLSKECDFPQNLQIQMKQSTSVFTNDIIQYNFDLTVPLC